MTKEDPLNPFPDAPSSLSGWVAAIATTVAAQGIDPAPLLERAGIASGLLSNPEARIPIKQVKLLWQFAVESTGDSAIGLKVPNNLNSASLFALNTLVEAAPNFQDGMRHLLTYLPVVTTAVDLDCCSIGNDEYEIRVRVLIPDDNPEGEDALVAALVQTLFITRPSRTTVRLISMKRTEPACPSEYETLLRGPVVFGSDKLFIRFHTTQAPSASLIAANPALELALQSVLADYLKRMENNNFVSRVRREIVFQMKHDEPTLECIAERFHMSGRTLQRKLTGYGSGYRQLTDEARKTLALELVCDTTLNITDIAYRLGFRNASNFGRVFRRWCGMSPSDYRRRNNR